MGTSLGLCVSPSEFKALGPYFLICEVGECGEDTSCVSQQMGPCWFSETQCVPVGGHSQGGGAGLHVHLALWVCCFIFLSLCC